MLINAKKYALKVLFITITGSRAFALILFEKNA